MNNQYKGPEYHKKYYQAHKAEISAKRKERQKQAKYKAYKHNYYMAHREEILAKQKAKNAAKKAVQGAFGYSSTTYRTINCTFKGPGNSY